VLVNTLKSYPKQTPIFVLQVSYKKLSKHLNVHVNEAKKYDDINERLTEFLPIDLSFRILPKFTEEISGDTCISETHLLSGKLSASDGEGFAWHICVVHKEDLNDIKKSSIYESSSSHVYAIYQGSRKTSEILPEFSTRLDELGHEYDINILCYSEEAY
jgi:hypothetical protein